MKVARGGNDAAVINLTLSTCEGKKRGGGHSESVNKAKQNKVYKTRLTFTFGRDILRVDMQASSGR